MLVLPRSKVNQLHICIHPLYFRFCPYLGHYETSLVAQTVKCLPTMRETQVQSLGQEDLLEKEIATHSSTLAWKIPWTEEPGGLQFMGSQRIGHDWASSLHYRPLQRVEWSPCDVQYVLAGYLFYWKYCVFVKPSVPVYSTPFAPWQPCLFSTSVILFVFINEFISTFAF